MTTRMSPAIIAPRAPPPSHRLLFLLLASICCSEVARSFRASSSPLVRPASRGGTAASPGVALARHRPSSVRSSTATDEASSTTTSSGISSLGEEKDDDDDDDGARLKRDRYVATNRFTVRTGREARFEKRWADRKSKLASLDGFRYFHLMRRVDIDGAPNSGVDPLGSSDPFGNYVSFTIWAEKKNFNAWRSGEAFKEAHGGTSLFAFVSTMVGSAMVLKGAPRPAFYDGLLHQSVVPDSIPETIDGWRSVTADGNTILPAECIVACNQFFVPDENSIEFEGRWRDRTSKLANCDGFVSFDLLRRDVKARGHGVSPMGEEEPTYMTCTIWRDRMAFEGWRSGSAFREAHGGSKAGEGGGEQELPRKPLWSRPPVPVFYEGTLVISSPEGA